MDACLRIREADGSLRKACQRLWERTCWHALQSARRQNHCSEIAAVERIARSKARGAPALFECGGRQRLARCGGLLAREQRCDQSFKLAHPLWERVALRRRVRGRVHGRSFCEEGSKRLRALW